MNKKYEFRDLLLRILITLIIIFAIPFLFFFICSVVISKTVGLVLGCTVFVGLIIITLCNLSAFTYCIFDDNGFIIRTLTGKRVEILWSDIRNTEYECIATSNAQCPAKPLCLLIYTDNYSCKPNIFHYMPKSGYAITFKDFSCTAKTAKRYLKEHSSF